MFRIVMMRAARQAFREGRISGEQLRKLRWSTLDDAQCSKLERFAREEIAEDEQGVQLIQQLGYQDDSITSQKLFENWDWEKFFDLLLKLAPIIIAFL